MSDEIEAWEQDAAWFELERKQRGAPVPSEDETEAFCERMALVQSQEGGYRFDYMARQAIFDEMERRRGHVSA